MTQFEGLEFRAVTLPFVSTVDKAEEVVRHGKVVLMQLLSRRPGSQTAADAAPVPVEVPIDEVMATVLGDPVAAVDLEQALRAGFSGGTAGDAVGEFAGAFPRFLLQRPPLDEEGLGELREVEVGVECGWSGFRCDRDCTRFR
jgi:hypothetical protein